MMVLAVGVFFLALSSPLALSAQAAGMTVLAIAFWRMAMATLLQAPLAAWELRGRQRGFRPPRRAVLLSLGAGAFLGAHFAGFIGALKLTSVASAITLTTLTPLLAALASRWLLGEKPPASFWPALALAMAGAAVMTSAEWSAGGEKPHAWAGNLLALLAAATATGYLMCGRQARAFFPLGLYAMLVYGVAGVCLGLGLMVSGASLWPAQPAGWLWCFLLALLPTTLGHNVVNWSLRHVSPAAAGLMILGEPPLTMALCWWLLGSEVSWRGAAGSAATLAGLGWFLRDQARRRRTAALAPRSPIPEQSSPLS
jgi:drug/metabolite transporter (DMT)-like permease